MYVTSFTKRLLRPCLIAALVLCPCMIRSASATPIAPTENLITSARVIASEAGSEAAQSRRYHGIASSRTPRNDTSVMTWGRSIILLPIDRYEFPSWTTDLTTLTVESLTPALFTVTQLPQAPESSPDFVSFQGLSAVLPSAIQSIPTHSLDIAEMTRPAFFCSDDITGSLLVNGEIFPILAYDDASFLFDQDHIIPDSAIPEPSTLILLTTALGSIYAYGLWRRRKHEAAQSSIAAAKQEEQMATIGKMVSEVIHDLKNTLTGMRTCAEVLGYDDLDPHERQEFARMIVSQVDQCMAMMQDLLDWSRPGRSSNTCQVEEFHRQTVEEPPMTRTMSVLLLDTEKKWFDEFQEAFQDLPITIYVASSQQEARRILASHSIKIAIFALRTLADLEFLHELNTSYRQIEVILTVENPVKEIVTILKEGAYRVMDAPVMPSTLRAYIETINTERRNIRR